MRTRVVLLAGALALVFTAVVEAHPLPGFPTGDLWVGDHAYFARVNMDDVSDPYVEGRWHRSEMFGVYDLAFDGNGHAIAILQGSIGEAPRIAVFDEDFETLDLIGSLETEALIRDIAVRNSEQVVGCHRVGQDTARVKVFDISDPANPMLALDQLIVSPWSNLSYGCEISFDADGRLWVAGHGFFSAFTLDEGGVITARDDYRLYGGGIPTIAVFQPGSGLLFYGAVNANFISVRDPADMATEVGRITDVCDAATHNVGRMAFDSDGNLVIGCHGGPDLLVFPASLVAGYAGTHARSDLSHHTFYDDDLYSVSVTEFAPAADPLVLIAGLMDVVEALDLDGGISASLRAKLAAALRVLEDATAANDETAVNLLTAFIGEVDAQTGKQIPPEDAATLTAKAQQIIDVLES